jgi:RNA polymerase sigma factor (sigma-70 family)
MITSQDTSLVSAVRSGEVDAFAALYDRHSRRLFALCLQMLRDHAEAEDALQQTFLDAYNAIRASDAEITLSPWLYKIARNECLSRIRKRREHSELAAEPAGKSLTAHAEQREELGELMRDLKRLPEEQATALTLSALGDLSHAQIGDVLGCDAAKVKSLVFRAHRALSASREARATDCADVRELLDELRGGSLRRVEIRDHLRDCAGCREYRERVRSAPVAA